MIINPYMARSRFIYPKQYAEDRHDIIVLGRLVNDSVRIGVPYNTIDQHIIVLGATGSGKTTTTAVLVSQTARLLKNVKPIIIDWHGEYSRLLDALYINPYSSLQINLVGNISDVMDVFEEVLELTPPQSYTLYKVLKALLDKHSSIEAREFFNKLIDYIDRLDETSSGGREAKYALLRKMSIFDRESARELFSGSFNLKRLISNAVKPVIIDVSCISDPSVRRAYTLTLLKHILNIKRRGANGDKIMLVLEEAHNLMPRSGSRSFLSRYVAEVRKYGIVLVIITQSPSSIIEDAMKNTGTKIIHSIRSSIDLDIVTKVIKLPVSYEKLLPVLDPGEAVFYNPVYKIPLLIRIEKDLIK